MVILIMSATGVLLAYERQILRWSDRQGYVGGMQGKRLSASELLSIAAMANHGSTAVSVTRPSDPREPARISFGGGQAVSVDPYAGRILSSPSPRLRAFFKTVTGVHRWFALAGVARARARKITGAANLLFLGIIVTGPFLWFPKRANWSRLRNVLFLRKGLGGKAREYNWHNVLGIWAVFPLFIVAASGVVISYPWATELVYRAVGEQSPPRRTSPPITRHESALSREHLRAIDRTEVSALEYVQQAVPAWRTLIISLNSEGPQLSVAIDEGSGGQPQLRRTANFGYSTGELISVETFDNQSAGRQLRSILRFAHTGEVLGLIGQTVAALASLAATVLVWTGLSLSFRRLMAWRRRRRPSASFTSPQ